MNKRVFFFVVLLRRCALLAAIACPYALFAPGCKKMTRVDLHGIQIPTCKDQALRLSLRIVGKT